jgi:hypothetical protein
MKTLVRSALLVGGIVGGLVLGQISTHGAVTISKAICLEANTNCSQCKYRIEGGTRCTSLVCSDSPLGFSVCTFKDGPLACVATEGTTGICDDCAVSTCGLVDRFTGTCDGCDCPSAGGNGTSTGWATCVYVGP